MQAVGFDGTPQALSVTKSETTPVDVKGNDIPTSTVPMQLEV